MNYKINAKHEKIKAALHATGEFLTLLGIFAMPFAAFWLKYIFWD